MPQEPPKTPLILLSGMGADERVFQPQLEAFANLRVLKWIEPLRDEPLESYGRRMAEQVDPHQPCFIGGASFGGFVALEMAAHLNAKACFLIGSVRSPLELPPLIRTARIAAELTRALPFGLMCKVAGVGANLGERWLRPETRCFLQQVSAADPWFLRWAARAVLTWSPTPVTTVPIYQIHGRRDRVLPSRYTYPDELLPGAGHLLSLSHGALVNQFLRSRMDPSVR